MNSIIRCLQIFIFITTAAAVISAQATAKPVMDRSSVPIVWVEYQIPSQKVSLSFPKLPVERTSSDVCAQTEGFSYHAYAAGAVYEFEVHYNYKDSIPFVCNSTHKFSGATFKARIEQLRSADPEYTESTGTVAGLAATVLRVTSEDGASTKTRWLIWDRDRWFELAITRRGDIDADEDHFTASFKLKSNAGARIGKGSDITLGDPDDGATAAVMGNTTGTIVVVAKPKPSYTDSARQNQVKGTVELHVVFRKNGAVGTITVASALPSGLTEQAIAAARKIAFLPAIVDGEPIDLARKVEYSFSIY